MTNLQNAILEACNDDVITAHEANILLEGYYRIPFPIGINKDIANELRTEIKQLCRLAGAQAFAISVQTTNKKGKYPVHKDFDNGIGRMRGAFYLGSDDGNGGLDIVLLDSDQIYTKTNGNLDSKPVSAIIHDILLTARKICGAPNPYMTYDGYAFFGSVDNISQMKIFQHCIDKPKKSEFMELGGVKLDDLFIESTDSYINESSGNTYDKVKWHTDNGEDEKEVHKRFKIIFSYLSKHKMLTDEGKEEHKLGISEETVINRSMLTADGNKFMSKYYDEMLRLDIEDMKRKLEKI